MYMKQKSVLMASTMEENAMRKKSQQQQQLQRLTIYIHTHYTS